jgi:type IV pilus assembly protein PilV
MLGLRYSCAGIRANRGVSLIEVLIAILVFSVGLLGLALMQLKGAQFTKESGARTAAILQARSIAEAMRANPDAAKAPWPAGATSATATPSCPYCYDGTQSLTLATCSSGSPCSPEVVAGNDLYTWVQRLKAAAPNPSTTGAKLAEITKEDDHTYTISVSWNGLQSVGGSQDVSYSFTYIP